MNSELRITDTNSANDSKGRALGLDGNDFLYVVVGIVAGIGTFLALYSLFSAALLTSAIVAACIVAGPTLWVLLFRHNKPDGYAEDFFDDLLNREGWGFAPGNQPAFPFHDDEADESASVATPFTVSVAAPLHAGNLSLAAASGSPSTLTTSKK